MVLTRKPARSSICAKSAFTSYYSGYESCTMEDLSTPAGARGLRGPGYIQSSPQPMRNIDSY